jgi:hypothetical protein
VVLRIHKVPKKRGGYIMKIFIFAGKVKDLKKYLKEWGQSLENQNK